MTQTGTRQLCPAGLDGGAGSWLTTSQPAPERQVLIAASSPSHAGRGEQIISPADDVNENTDVINSEHTYKRVRRQEKHRMTGNRRYFRHCKPLKGY